MLDDCASPILDRKTPAAYRGTKIRFSFRPPFLALRIKDFSGWNFFRVLKKDVLTRLSFYFSLQLEFKFHFGDKKVKDISTLDLGSSFNGSLLSMIIDAGFVVKFVLLLLFIFSVISLIELIELIIIELN